MNRYCGYGIILQHINTKHEYNNIVGFIVGRTVHKFKIEQAELLRLITYMCFGPAFILKSCFTRRIIILKSLEVHLKQNNV